MNPELCFVAFPGLPQTFSKMPIKEPSHSLYQWSSWGNKTQELRTVWGRGSRPGPATDRLTAAGQSRIPAVTPCEARAEMRRVAGDAWQEPKSPQLRTKRAEAAKPREVSSNTGITTDLFFVLREREGPALTLYVRSTSSRKLGARPWAALGLQPRSPWSFRGAGPCPGTAVPVTLPG